ncbi:MAG: hypothetical protein HKN39_07680 [Flavobacteriales bacterium]|nr:hypothetical protein [Flavobacteriales bacterium]
MTADNTSALISMIEDPDVEIYDQVKKDILNIGRKTIPYLTEFKLDHPESDIINKRVDALINDLKSLGIEEALNDWLSTNNDDLLEGVLLVAKYQYPELNSDEVKRELAKMRQDIWLELCENLTAFEKVNVINHILFEVYGFAGSKKNYHAPKNSFINAVLETKSGNPLSLAIIYMILAQSLDIPVYGVNLPNHFILAYKDENMIIEELREFEPDIDHTEDVLFYINPFSNGSILHKSQINNFLQHLELEPEPKHFKPCSNVEIVRRLFNNLVYAYQKLGYTDKVDEVIKIASVLKS